MCSTSSHKLPEVILHLHFDRYSLQIINFALMIESISVGLKIKSNKYEINVKSWTFINYA